MVIEKKTGDILTLHFPLYQEFNWLIHAFSTRYGGVSEGIYASMNFKVDAEDSKENVYENYRRMASALGCDLKKMVRAGLVHGNRVHLVEKKDCGEGIYGTTGLKGYDALITDLSGITLVATYADCVPLYFVDVKHHAIGLAHSGWKGTVLKIGLETVKAMKKAFHTQEGDLYAAIGPCICGNCYEVGEEVKKEFETHFLDGQVPEISFSDLITDSGMGKYHLDLKKANEWVFREAGILPEHMQTADLCTCCNPELLFSHRATKGKRGAVAAFLGIREKHSSF